MTTQYIASIALDEASIAGRSKEINHERTVAVNDLIEWNHVTIKKKDGTPIDGPYDIALSATESRIVLAVTSSSLAKPATVTITTAPFRSIIRDYFLICESYFDAVKNGNLPRIEAIDMSRRGLHNEGAELLMSLTSEKIEMDYETARRLFTLIYALHLK